MTISPTLWVLRVSGAGFPAANNVCFGGILGVAIVGLVPEKVVANSNVVFSQKLHPEN